METQEISYQEAYDELQAIVREIEDNSVSVDILSEKIKRSMFLIDYCKQKLQKIEIDVDKLIEDIEA
ncbi:MAG: exodeoxyribonuclease VII small subunit [Bacteroidales bacterium]|nr:exodeoxyribonuclease VII small subunit [Candidatus Scybalousia scybalohippi]